MNLIIVESPNKTKKIQQYVGSGYEVVASAGHIRDMPAREMGVAAPDYKPTYELNKNAQDRVKRLKAKVRNADMVFLATDPDREGEAIAWHLLDVLKPKRHCRISFNAITKTAVQNALANPGQIDMDLVHAQEGRRVLDRLVGYTVSPLLNKITASPVPLSAGRVQTPATAIVVERDEAIENFKPTDHFKLKVHFKDPGSDLNWTAGWQHKPLQKALCMEETDLFIDRDFVEQVAQALTGQPVFMVYKVEGKNVSRNPPAPFTTSKMQQVAANRLGFSVDRTMKAAQALFEAGVITYHRSDSQNIDEEPAEEIRRWLAENNLPIPEQRNTWSSKADAQEAHEAVRPTEVTVVDPEDFPPGSDGNMLYKLIRERTIVSQMAPARYFSVTAVLVSALKVQGVNLQFVARGRTLLEPGFLTFAHAQEGLDVEGNEKEGSDDDEPEDANLPKLEEGQHLQCSRGEAIATVTKPPARLTLATLIAELERHGIGRPGTLASIIGLIFSRGYVEERKKKIFATELGKRVIGVLKGRFSFARLDFTRVMEGGLDKVANGKATYLQVVSYQHQMLSSEVESLMGDPSLATLRESMSDVFGEQVDCPSCGQGKLVRKKGASGHFYSCNRYPDCTASCQELKGSQAPNLDTIRTKSDAPKLQVVSASPCPKCKKSKMVQRSGSNGLFWSCKAYPKCKGTANDKDGAPDIPSV